MSKIVDLLKLKDYVTLSGTILGLIAILLGTTGNRAMISWAFFLLAFTIGTDLADGYIARKTGTVNEIGKELDSLNDSLTFGIAPAVLTFHAFRTGDLLDILLLFGCVCFALGAILRLARFNISKTEGYTGVPTPLTGLVLLTYFYANYFYAAALSGGGDATLIEPFSIYVYALTPFLLIFLGWSNITVHIQYGKKEKKVYIIFILFAPLCPIFGVIGILNPSFIVAVIVSAIFYIFVSIIIVFILYGLIRKIITQNKNESSNRPE